MRVASLVLSSVFITHAFAFPWLAGQDSETMMASMKRGLQAMSADEDLVRQIRDLHTQQQREVREWEAASNKNNKRNKNSKKVVRGIIGGLIDIIVGDVGTVAGYVDSLAASVQGSKRFPEAAYPYQAPGPTDQRGPCPGMNTLANHGYVPRNGIVTAGQAIGAVAQLFNMGVEIASVLVAGNVGMNGDTPSLRFSLGGADARTNSLGKLGGALGTQTGLNGHYGVVESDASPSRCDFFKCSGDNHNMKPELFAQMLQSAQTYGGGQFTPYAMAKHFHARYEDSLATNPSFKFVPPSGLIAIGAHYFYPGFFSNGTIGSGGVANLASIASFVGAHFTDDNKIEYVPERIPPQGWFRRAVPMTFEEGLAGILYTYSTPYPVAFGGNANGKFVPGPGLLPTNAQDVNGLGCFLYNFLYADFFSQFENILSGIEGSVSTIVGLIDPSFVRFGCTPNFPTDTAPNRYGGAAAVLNGTSQLPGAGKKQPCLNMSGQTSDCITETNKYDETDVVPNRFRFGSYNDGAGNVRPQ